MDDKYEGIILELMLRIQKLEKEINVLNYKISELDSKIQSNNQVVEPRRLYSCSMAPTEDYRREKDKTRYLYNNEIYLKNRLVIAVIKDFVKKYPEITGEGLKEQFKDSLQGAIGVVDFIDVARRKKPRDCDIRYFTKNEDIVHVSDGDMYVCSQWGILNIPNFIARARQLGFEIEEINK